MSRVFYTAPTRGGAIISSHACAEPSGTDATSSWLSLLLLAATGSLLLIVRATSPAQHIDIPGVPPQALEQAGIRFLAPNGTPAVSEEKARLVAMTEAPTFDLPILQTVLVRLVDVSAVPPVDQLVWVNMIDLTGQTGSAVAPGLFPSAGNYWGEEPIRVERTYHLIFIDATTGEYIYAISG